MRSTPKRYLPSSITSTPYGSGYGSPSDSSGPSSPGSLAVDEAEIERELFMDVDRASLAQEEEEERLISNMVRSASNLASTAYGETDFDRRIRFSPI
jgi:hypothetical protein